MSNEHKLIARNKRARFDYEITETLEAGIILKGSELKPIRQGRSSINESHAGEMQGSLFLFNMNIEEYTQAHRQNHEPKRPRQLLVRKRQLNKWLGAIGKKGMTIIPISVYFNDKGLVKVQLGLGRGKKTVDKRETIKQRDWERSKAKILRSRG